MKKDKRIIFGVVMTVIGLILVLSAGHIAGIPVIFVIIFIVNVLRRIQAQNKAREGSSGQDETAGNACGEEEKTGQESSYVGTIITCDYCGSRVDTAKHTVCDHCGGPYGDDEEWKEIQRRRRGAR